MDSEFESTSDRFGKGIIAIAMGIGLIFVALKFGHYVSKNYIETPCVLKQVSFGINSKSYDMATEFDYEFKGKTYTSEKFSDQKTFSDSSDVRRASEVERAFDADKKIICYVLEDDPSEAYLVEPTFGFYLKWGVFACGVFILLTGLGYIAQVLTDNFVPGARAYLGLFFSASMLMVAVIGSYFIYPCLSQVLDSGNWKRADAVVDHRFYDVSVNDEGEKSYFVEILYRYKYKNKVYRSTQYNFINSSTSSKDEAIRIGKKYTKGKRFKCYVDPDDPEYSVIEKESFLVCLLTFAILACYLIAFICFRGWGVKIEAK